MFQRLSKITGLLLTLFGVYQIFEYMSEALGNTILSLAVVFGLVVIWLFYELVRYVYNPFVFKFFSAKPIVDALITNVKIELFVDESGQATSHSWRTYIFKSEVREWETFDTLFVKGSFLNNIGDYYQSDDSKVTSHRRLKGNRVLVFWKPETEKIYPHIPYEHHYTYRPPTNFNDDKNFYILYKICPVGVSEFIVNAHRKLKAVWAVEIEDHIENFTEEIAERIVKETKIFSIPQPEKKDFVFSWKARGTEFSKPILIFWEYETENSSNKGG